MRKSVVHKWSRIDKSDEFIQSALAEANPIVLRALLHQIGDRSVENIEVGTGPGLYGREIAIIKNPADVQLMRDRLFEHLRRNRDERVGFPPPPTARKSMYDLAQMAMGASFPEEDLDFWLEESGLQPMVREVDWASVPIEARQRLKVVIIGAGFAGIYAAIQLKRAGVPFLVFEKNAGAGGTWYENIYPGIRVDVPSQVYSYSFEPHYPWKHLFAPQSELATYINYVVDKYEIRDNIQFDTEVTGAHWDDRKHCWQIDVSTAAQTPEIVEANAIISAVGLLNRLKMPDIDGIDSFEGQTMHTSRWNWSVDLSQKRVAVIGTGSSGMQLTPDLAPLVGHLTVFQRSAGWVVTLPGYRDPLSEQSRWLWEAVPYYANWVRLFMAYGFSEYINVPGGEIDPDWSGDPLSINDANDQLRQQLLENMRAKIGHRPDLLAKCTPDYPPMAKRIVMDNGWFDALLRDNVNLQTEPIARITPKGILLKNGEEIAFDVIVFASGFRASEFLYPMQIVGREGVTLNKFWSKDGARAYLGMMMPYFPNLWCLYGPNSNPRSGNPILQAENATRYIVNCLRALVEQNLYSVEVRQDVFNDYQDRLDRALSTTIWNDKRQSSYYRNDEHGRIDVMTPWGATQYWKMTKELDLNHLVCSPLDGEANHSQLPVRRADAQGSVAEMPTL